MLSQGESESVSLVGSSMGVEMDAYNVNLVSSKDTARDGKRALLNKRAMTNLRYSCTLWPLLLSAFLWMLVMYRKMKYGEDDEFEADQTDVVAEEMEVEDCSRTQT